MSLFLTFFLLKQLSLHLTMNALRIAAFHGNEEEVVALLAAHPGTDVNFGGTLLDFPEIYLMTALHLASARGHANVVRVLLEHPNIDPNRRSRDGKTPFHLACIKENAAVMELLLRHPQTQPNIPSGLPVFPIDHLIVLGSFESLQMWIASGKPLELGEQGTQTDKILMAQRWKYRAAYDLLLQYRTNPEQTVEKVREQIGWVD